MHYYYYIKRRSPEEKLLFFWILSKLPPSPLPQLGQLVQLFSDVEIQDLIGSLGLKILYALYITQIYTHTYVYIQIYTT